MILRFPYLEEPIQGSPPPSLPPSAQRRWRPLVPITVYGPTGLSLSFGRALVDSGADDTIFPLDVATYLGIPLLAVTGHAMSWRGQRHVLRFGTLDLELEDDLGNRVRWSALAAFTTANVRYPLLGVAGCLEFWNVKLFGKDREIELEPNDSLPSAIQP